MTTPLRLAISALAALGVAGVQPFPMPDPSPALPTVVQPADTAVDVELIDPPRGPAPRPHGKTPQSARALARLIAGDRGWDTEPAWSCLDQLWEHESGWRFDVSSATDDHGIPQAHAPVHPETDSEAWRTSPASQVDWGLAYIANRYGHPCAAWTVWQERAARRGGAGSY